MYISDVIQIMWPYCKFFEGKYVINMKNFQSIGKLVTQLKKNSDYLTNISHSQISLYQNYISLSQNFVNLELELIIQTGL